jgi:hypothetical protein
VFLKVFILFLFFRNIKIKIKMNLLCQRIYTVDLYELNHKFLWIRDIIYTYNDYGFYTTRSQPGRKNEVLQYKTLKHQIDDNKNESIITDRYQRAYVNGYMDKNMAIFITNALNDHPYLFCRNEIDNKIFTDNCKLGSVTFKNDKPEINEMPDDYSNLENILDTQESFNLNLPLRRPLKIIESDIKDCDDIIEFEMIDTRWNNNDDLWKTLLHLILYYNS